MSVVYELKSDQNGIEIDPPQIRDPWGRQLKSDQNGIEISRRPWYSSTFILLKSDQNGIEINIVELWMEIGVNVLKSDQNGIEIPHHIEGAVYLLRTC